jgi:hypothetical protein
MFIRDRDEVEAALNSANLPGALKAIVKPNAN